MKSTISASPRRRGKMKKAAGKTAKAAKPKRRRVATPVEVSPAPTTPAPPPKPRPAAMAEDSAKIEQLLRAWRLAEAKRHGVPAFRIFTDKALRAIVEQRPSSARELLAIPGIGISAVEKYGAHIYRILHEGAGGR
jgi:superfamily II DNA helicase RecQ